MASIDKRSNGSYRARWREFPGAPQQARHFKKKAQAEQFLRDVEVQLTMGTYVDPSAGAETFETYARRWLAAQVGKPQTVAKITSLLNKHLIPAFGSKPLRSIRTTEVQAYVKKLSQTHQPATVQVTYGYLAAVFNGAVADHLITRSPCSKIRLPEKPKRRVQVFDMATVGRLADGLPDRLSTMVWLAVGSGMRVSEIRGLSVDRVDFLRRSITVDRQLVFSRGSVGPVFDTPKTKASNRTIPVAEATTLALAAHLERFAAGDYGLIFTNEDGSPLRMDQVQHHVRVAREKGKVDGSFHVLRHTYASILITAGESPKVVQERLGHATVAQTMSTYAHLWPEDDQRTRDIMERMLGQSSPAALRIAPDEG